MDEPIIKTEEELESEMSMIGNQLTLTLVPYGWDGMESYVAMRRSERHGESNPAKFGASKYCQRMKQKNKKKR